MRKHVFFWKNLAGILPFLFLGTACDSASDDPEPFLRINEANQSITFSSEESSQTIAVETNTSEWTVSVNADGKWCTAVKDGESIVISVGKNEGLSERSTTITASARNVEVKITVTQLGATPVLQIKEDDKAITFENFGGDVPVAITTNLSADEWDIVFSDPTVSGWCHIQKGNNQFKISADENIGTEARTAEITITSSRIPAEQQPKISVVQFGTAYTLVVPESNKSFTAAPGNSTVTLQTNIPSGQWSYVVDEGWCHAEVVKTSDNKDNQLKITVDENSSLEQRIAVITISSSLLSDVHPTITVTQAGVDPILQVANSTQNLAVTGEEVNLDIITNLPLGELSVELSDPAATWCAPSIDGGKLKITVEANTGQTARNATVTIKDTQRPTAPQAIVSVTQELPTLTIAENENTQNIEAVGGKVSLSIITTNIPFGELSVVSTDGWCNAAIENGKLEITVQSNTGDDTPERQTELTISSVKLPGIEAKLTVIQLGTKPVLQIPVGSDAPSFGYQGGSQIIALTTNILDIGIVYDNQPSSIWCSAIITNKQLTITVTPNTGETERYVTITLSAEDVPSVTITVTQAPVPSLEVTDNTVSFESTGGNKIVDITTNIPVNDWSALSDATWCHVEQSSDHLTIIADVTPGLEERTATITVSSTLIPLPKTITVTQGKIDTGTDFSITGYENQIFDVAFYNNATTSKLALDANGNGRLATTNSNLMIKSIKAAGGSEIFIGRKEASGDIKLAVNNHAIQWRTKTNDDATALIGTVAEFLLRFNAAASVTTYEFEADIDLMDQTWAPITSTFSKTIDGKHYKIYNLNVNLGTLTGSTNNRGGIVATLSGVIRNLHIASGEITYSGGLNGRFVGGLVGVLSSNGKIIGCSNAANITGDAFAGGICGQLNGTADTVDETQIIGCANYGNITLTGERGGGVVSTTTFGTVTACYNTGNVTAIDYLGGVGGRLGTSNSSNHASKFSACYNVGTVTGTTLSRTGALGYHSMGTLTLDGYSYYKEGCTNGTGTASGSLNNNVFAFSDINWPTNDDSKNWGIGDGTNGNYWSSVGSWNEETPTYPKLYWE